MENINTEKIEIKNPTPELKEFFENWQERKRLQVKEMKMKYDHVMPVEGLDEIKAVECALRMWQQRGVGNQMFYNMSSDPVVGRVLKRAEEYRKKLENK